MTVPHRILVIDDEENLAASLSVLLRGEGFQVQLCTTLTAAQQVDLAGIHLVLLDWTLPDGQGIDLLKEWRARGHDLPVIMLTARSQLIDKVIGLELGADDYMTKPFEPRELVARVRTRLRNHGQRPGAQTPASLNPPAEQVIRLGGFEMFVDRHELFFRGTREDLTKMEWNLLRLFLENPSRVYSREELLNSVWGLENYPTTRTVDNHVLQLRQKFGSALFETVRGVGYRFCPAGEDIAQR